MIRASSAHRITTNRPFFDEKVFQDLSQDLANKAEKKGKKYQGTLVSATTMLEVAGLKTAAKEVVKQFEKKALFKTDPLPDGAKTYLQELWLDNNYNFHDFATADPDFALKKGTISETEAIAFLSGHLGQSLVKNETRVSLNFLTGEADIFMPEERRIRDIKCPKNWKTFKNKTGIENTYHWQLVTYCLLYDCVEASLDYILMPTPQELIEDEIRGFSAVDGQKYIDMQYQISQMPSAQRVKSYSIDTKTIQKDIQFLLSRVEKAKAYYETLTYETCMKINY